MIVDVLVEISLVERIISVQQPSARNVGLEALLKDGNEIVLVVIFTVEDVANEIRTPIMYGSTRSPSLLILLFEILHVIFFSLESSYCLGLLLILHLNIS